MTPGTDLDPATLLAAPAGYIAVILSLAIYLAKEIRKARQVRVTDAETERDAEKARRLQVERDRDADVQDLQKDNTELRGENRALRDQIITDTQTAFREKAELIRANGALLALLAKHGIDPKERQ